MLSCATSAFGLSAQELVRQYGCRTKGIAKFGPLLISQLLSRLNRLLCGHAHHNG